MREYEVTDADVVEGPEDEWVRAPWDERAGRGEEGVAEPGEAPAGATIDGSAGETVDAVPVLARVRALEPASAASLPAVQAAAVAATGFVAGAATLALVRRRQARRLARARPSGRRTLDALPIVGSRSFLVDVHLIAKPGE